MTDEHEIELHPPLTIAALLAASVFGVRLVQDGFQPSDLDEPSDVLESSLEFTALLVGTQRVISGDVAASSGPAGTAVNADVHP